MLLLGEKVIGCITIEILTDIANLNTVGAKQVSVVSSLIVVILSEIPEMIGAEVFWGLPCPDKTDKPRDAAG